MGAEQGMGTGRVPGLNTERIYTTTVPAEGLRRSATAPLCRPLSVGAAARMPRPRGASGAARRAGIRRR